MLGSADVSATGFCSGLCQFHDHADVLGTPVRYAFIGNAQKRAERAEALVALQKQVAALLGTPLSTEPS